MLAISSVGLIGIGAAAWVVLLLGGISLLGLRKGRARRGLAILLMLATGLAVLVPGVTLPIPDAAYVWLGYFGGLVLSEIGLHAFRALRARDPASAPDIFGPPERREQRLSGFDQMSRQATRLVRPYALGFAALTVALTVLVLVVVLVER